MKAVSLWQPWASLIAVGGKRIETRHWRAPARVIGQRIAIHAALRGTELWLCRREPFTAYVPEPDALPRGAIVATAVLDRCTEMTADSIAQLAAEQPDEHAFGYYEVGRFAWVLTDVTVLDAPVPFRGRQGIFDVPDEVLS